MLCNISFIVFPTIHLAFCRSEGLISLFSTFLEVNHCIFDLLLCKSCKLIFSPALALYSVLISSIASLTPAFVTGSNFLLLSAACMAVSNILSTPILNQSSSAFLKAGVITFLKILLALFRASTPILDSVPAIFNGDKPLIALKGSLAITFHGLTTELFSNILVTVDLGLISDTHALYACNASASLADLDIGIQYVNFPNHLRIDHAQYKEGSVAAAPTPILAFWERELNLSSIILSFFITGESGISSTGTRLPGKSFKGTTFPIV